MGRRAVAAAALRRERQLSIAIAEQLPALGRIEAELRNAENSQADELQRVIRALRAASQ